MSIESLSLAQRHYGNCSWILKKQTVLEVNLGRAKFLGSRVNGQKYKWITYSQAKVKIEKLASVLAYFNIFTGDRVAILGQNCPELVMFELTLFRQGAISAPLHPSCDFKLLLFCLRRTGAKVILTHSSRLEDICKITHRAQHLKLVILLDKPENFAQLAAQGLSFGINVVSLSDVETFVDESPPPNPPPVSATSHLVFLENITDEPDCVAVSHSMICSAIDALKCVQDFEVGYGFSSTDVHISWVSNATMFEIVLSNAIIGECF